MADLKAAALAKAIRLSMQVPDDGRQVAPGIEGSSTHYGQLESFHVHSIHEFCAKLLATGYVTVDESILKR